jgi:CheY-like chemotaxis protein
MHINDELAHRVHIDLPVAMTTAMIQPFSFPTTVGFIDDSATFLANLSLQLDSQLAFRFFSSAERALSAINEESPHPWAAECFFSRYRDRGEESDTQEVIAMSLDVIWQQVQNERRFEHTSVVVVDYDMPGMNGLEMCRRIANPAIKKIVLTGKADEHLAVQGFNEGIIDRFIRKQDAGAIPALNQAINEMQSAYIKQTQHAVADTLALSAFHFLVDPAFAEKTSEIFRTLGIVEHYLWSRPGGLLMLDSAGTRYLLLVFSEEAQRATREIAVLQDAPSDFLAELDSHRSVPYFWDSDGHYPSGCVSWQRYMHPATAVQGKDTYLYTVIKNPPGFRLDPIFTYDDYLERLDQDLHATWGSQL